MKALADAIKDRSVPCPGCSGSSNLHKVADFLWQSDVRHDAAKASAEGAAGCMRRTCKVLVATARAILAASAMRPSETSVLAEAKRAISAANFTGGSGVQ